MLIGALISTNQTYDSMRRENCQTTGFQGYVHHLSVSFQSASHLCWQGRSSPFPRTYQVKKAKRTLRISTGSSRSLDAYKEVTHSLALPRRKR